MKEINRIQTKLFGRLFDFAKMILISLQKKIN